MWYMYFVKMDTFSLQIDDLIDFKYFGYHIVYHTVKPLLSAISWPETEAAGFIDSVQHQITMEFIDWLIG